MPTLLVIGATSDIARACARIFAANGYDLILAGKRVEVLDADKTDFAIRYGVNVFAAELDVTAVDGHKDWYARLNPKPDVVLCAAGVLGNQASAQKNGSQARDILAVNFAGCALLLEVIAADFEERKSGSIIGISSVAGERGRQSNYLYGSAKAGLTAYLSGLRNRLYKSGVHVLTVKPGFVRTRMTEGLPLPGALTAEPDAVAKDIYNAWRKGKPVLYTKWHWRWIMLVIRMVPERVFRKMSL